VRLEEFTTIQKVATTRSFTLSIPHHHISQVGNGAANARAFPIQGPRFEGPVHVEAHTILQRVGTTAFLMNRLVRKASMVGDGATNVKVSFMEADLPLATVKLVVRIILQAVETTYCHLMAFLLLQEVKTTGAGVRNA